MKLTVTKEHLASAVSKADKITGKNLSLSVLRGILLLAKDGVLKIRSTNLDLGIEIAISAKVDEEGVVVVPGSVFNSLLSSLYSTGAINLIASGGNMSVISGGSESLIKALNHTDFPTLPSKDGAVESQVEALALAQGLRSVWFSAASSGIKPELASVYIYTEKSHIVFVATDSFRLSEKRFVIDKKTKIEPILIPLKNVAEIIRNLEDCSGVAKLYTTKNQLTLVCDDTYITSRVIDGSFPDYKQIIPKDHKTEAVLLKQDLLNALKLSNVFSNKFNQVGFRVHPKDKEFVLRIN